MPLLEEDFEDYDAEVAIAEHAGDPWFTWMYTAGDATDPLISTSQAQSGTKSLYVADLQDAVLRLERTTEPTHYQIDFLIYVEADRQGYFNVLQTFWNEQQATDGADAQIEVRSGVEAFLQAGGTGVVAAAGQEFTFEYPPQTWLTVSVEIDLTKDEAKLSIAGEQVADWTWSTGADGDSDNPSVAGLNFFGTTIDAMGMATGAGFHIDDISVGTR